MEWSWKWEQFEGRTAKSGQDYFFYDGHELRVYQRWPTEKERYSFNIHEDGYLVGSAVVEVRPISVLEDVKPMVQLAGEKLPFGGPYFHALNGHTHAAMMVSTYIHPGKPARVFFALAESVESLALPTYAFFVNNRLVSIVERRYSPSANDLTKMVT